MAARRPRQVVTPGETPKQETQEPQEQQKPGVSLQGWELREDGWHYVGDEDQKNN